MDKYLSGMDKYLSGMDKYLSGMDKYLSGMDQTLFGLKICSMLNLQCCVFFILGWCWSWRRNHTIRPLCMKGSTNPLCIKGGSCLIQPNIQYVAKIVPSPIINNVKKLVSLLIRDILYSCTRVTVFPAISDYDWRLGLHGGSAAESLRRRNN
jgi:hypothetical protein